MAEHVLNQVEDRIAAVLLAWPALAGKAIGVVGSQDIAIDELDIAIATAAYGFEVADENNQTLHSADIDVESITHGPAAGFIARANREVLAEALAAIAADRSLGIGIQDIQEIDIASADGRGRDVDASSVRFRVLWFTPRDDWFTIA